MPATTWQKSSHCAQGEACVHISVTAETVLLSDSATPTPSSVLSTGHDAFTAFVGMLKARNGEGD